MRNLRFVLWMCLVGLTPAIAQKTFTLPAKGIHTGTLGRGFIIPAKKWLPTRQQCLYSTKDLPKTPIAIREVAFQPRPDPPRGHMEAALVTLTLDLSLGPRAPRKWSPIYSKNLGKTVTRVFSGKIQLPTIIKTTKPDWYFRIPFQRPFIISKTTSPSLVLDFHTTAVVTKMSGFWFLAQGKQDSGTGKTQGIGYNCHFKQTFWLGACVTG